MKKTHSISLFFLSVITNLSVLAQTDNPLFRHLPPNAEEVYHVNLPVLAAKIGWEDLASRIPASAGGSDQKMMSLLKDPASSGIDFHHDIFFTESKADPTDSSSWKTVVFNITDSAKFIATLRTIEKSFHVIALPGKVHAAGYQKTGLVYDDHLVVFTSFTPGKNPAQAKKPGAAAGASVNYARLAAQKSLVAFNGYDNSFFNTDQRFKTAFSDDADFHMLTPQGSSLKTLGRLLHKSPGEISSVTKSFAAVSSKVITTLRFDAGKITVRSTLAIEPDQAALFAKILSTPLNTDLLARVPGGDLLGMAALHFDPTAIGDILDKYHARAKLDSILAKKDLSAADVLAAFKGDFIFSAVRTGTASSSSGKPVVFYFTAAISNPLTFMKVGTKLQLVKDPAATGDAPQGNGIMGKMKTAYKFQDNTLVISGTQEDADAYFTNTAKRSVDFATDRTKTGLFSIFVDLRMIASFLQGMSNGTSSGKDQQILYFMQALQSVTINLGGIKGAESETYIEIKMTDEKENSLRSLINLLPRNQ